MKYKVLIVFSAVALIAAGCNSSQKSSNLDQNLGSSQTQNQNPNPVSQPPAPTPPTPSPSPSAATDTNNIQVIGIDITANGFSPANVTIHVNDYVQFTNKDTDLHWPASNPHPIHNGYPGFDALHGLQQGEKYRFEFKRTGTFGYHDHLNPSVGGTITVLP